MLYVPNAESYACVVVQNAETIRAYKTVPSYNTSSEYTDFFVQSHYMSKEGVQDFSRYVELPQCLSTEKITSDFYYRNDMPDILLMFTIFCLFCFVLPLKIFVRLFRRYQ